MRVEQIMSQPPKTCSPSSPLNEAAQAMWDGDVGCVVAVDHHGVVAGLVTDRDICMAAYTQGRPIQFIPVETAMAGTVHTCRPKDSLQTALETMRLNKIRRLPVIDDKGHPIGLVSISDILRCAQGHDPVGTAEALAGIVEPRGPRGLTSRPKDTLVETQPSARFARL